MLRIQACDKALRLSAWALVTALVVISAAACGSQAAGDLVGSRPPQLRHTVSAPSHFYGWRRVGGQGNRAQIVHDGLDFPQVRNLEIGVYRKGADFMLFVGGNRAGSTHSSPRRELAAYFKAARVPDHEWYLPGLLGGAMGCGHLPRPYLSDDAWLCSWMDDTTMGSVVVVAFSGLQAVFLARGLRDAATRTPDPRASGSSYAHPVSALDAHPRSARARDRDS